jgi:hypothetical protein
VYLIACLTRQLEASRSRVRPEPRLLLFQEVWMPFLKKMNWDVNSFMRYLR